MCFYGEKTKLVVCFSKDLRTKFPKKLENIMKNIISGLMIYDIQQSMKKLGWEQD
jgi:hypothetical protein